MSLDSLWLINSLAYALMLMGAFFIITAVIGLIRFPDSLTKIHAVSVSDSLGIPLFLCGTILLNGYNLVSLKVGLIIMLIYIVNPMITMELGSYFISQNSKSRE